MVLSDRVNAEERHVWKAVRIQRGNCWKERNVLEDEEGMAKKKRW